MKIKRSTPKKARVEMIPLIDCMFLLIVFFIYVMLSMVVHKGIAVDLPQASAAEVNKKDYLSITITKEGVLFLNKQTVTLAALPEVLAVEKENNPDLHVFINADKKAFHGQVIQVLDVLRILDIQKVFFETEAADNNKEIVK